jgi:hypothetical protein
VSDQDFFFDEDEQPKAADKAAKPEATKSAAAKPSAKAAPAAPAAPAGQMVTTTVAGLIGVVALLAGLVIGILLPVGGTTPTASTQVPAAVTGTQSAPQLTPEQLQGSELPPGHPDVGSMGGGSGAATGSAETTSN